MPTTVNNDIFLDCMFSLILVFLIALSSMGLGKSQRETAKRYKGWDVNNKGDCSSYLNSIKTGTITASYAVLGASFVGLLTFAMLPLLQINNENNQRYALTFFVTIASFAIFYKIFGCFLYRSICGLEYCK